MAEKQVRIDLQANDKASEKIRDVADEAKKLEKLDPEVEVDADTKDAERKIEDVADDLKELQRRDTEIVLTGKVSHLKSELSEAETALKQVQNKAEDTKRAVDDIGGTQGPRIAGNQVSDLTGPLGEASGAAGDFGGVFDGLADIVEGSMTRMGGAAAAMAPQMATALGGVGFAVAGIAAAWSYFSGKAKKAQEDQQKLLELQRDINDAIAEGDVKSAAKDFEDAYGGALDKAEKFGLSVQDTTKYITGQVDAIPGIEDAYAQATAVLGEYNSAQAWSYDASEKARFAQAQQVVELVGHLESQRQKYIETNGALDDQDARLAEVESGLEQTTTDAQKFADAQDRVKRNLDKTKDAMDRLRGSLDMERALLRFGEDFQAAHDKAVAGTKLTADEILGLKEDILDVAEYADLNPVEVKSLLDRIEAGDYLGVKTDVETMAKNNPPSVETKLQTPSDLALQNWLSSIQRRINAMGGRVYVPGGGFVQPGGTAATASVPVTAASVVNVTQNVPRGYHGDVLADAQAAAKRSGGLYQRNSR